MYVLVKYGGVDLGFCHYIAVCFYAISNFFYYVDCVVICIQRCVPTLAYVILGFWFIITLIKDLKYGIPGDIGFYLFSLGVVIAIFFLCRIFNWIVTILCVFISNFLICLQRIFKFIAMKIDKV